MKQLILTQFPWPWLSVLGLVLFFGFFVGLLIRLSLKSNQKIFHVAEQLPLEEGERCERQ